MHTIYIIYITITTHAHHFAAGGGKAVFTRWGSLKCPAGTKQVYAGSVASGLARVEGGAGNYLCMHPEPEFFLQSEGMVSGNQNGASLLGVEYRGSGRGAFDKNINQDVGCVVCEHESASSLYVQWGRKTCTNGHKTVYYGLIMTNPYLRDYKSESICVDWARSPSAGSKADHSLGGMLVPTEWYANNVGNYKKGYELSCAVCAPEQNSVVYSRWGSNECPSGTTMLYKSLIASAREDDHGSSFNFLCLHPQPEYPEGVKLGIDNGAYLLPVEYRNTGAVDKNQHHDAGCAVCQRKKTASVNTQWGRKSCTNDHQLEYYGIIMASHHEQKKTEFICVDWERAAHTLSGINNGDDVLWTRLYSTEVHTGALEDAYELDKELSCAVCSSALPVYTMWGAMKCPGESTKLYDGSMAASYRMHTGGGYNFLCMHPEPEWPEGVNTGKQLGALLYGVEYHDTGSLDKNDRHDAGCVVCQMQDTSKGVPYVQWGRRTCSGEYKTVTTGLVMANYNSHDSKTEFLCVDWERATHKTSSKAHQHSLFLFSTEFEDGPYWGMDTYGRVNENKEVACVWCGV